MNKLPPLYITITTWFSECIHNCNTLAKPCVLTCWQAKKCPRSSCDWYGPNWNVSCAH